MRNKKILLLSFISIVIIISNILIVSALTASIGNSRMVLRLDKGETIERSILVRNVNSFPVNIELAATGDSYINSGKFAVGNFLLNLQRQLKHAYGVRNSRAALAQ